MNNPLALVKRRFETFLYVPGRRAMLSAEQRAKRFFRGRVAAILLCALAFLALHPAKAGSDLPVPDGWTKTWEDGATSIELSHATRNWSDFSIGNGFAVRFTGSGTAVNKVTGGVRSDIFGTLTGDKVYILNPNGILFGSSARVDVNGLVAAAAGAVENGADGMVFSKLGSGSVVNQGTINAGKFAYLVGKSVENSGSIRAGEVALAAFGGTGAESLTIASAPNGATITFDIPEDAAPADEEEGDGVVSSGSLAGSEDAKAQGRDPILRASNPTDVGTPDGDGNINVTMSGSNIKVEEDIVGKNVNLRATQYINVGKADGSVQASVTATEGDIELASDGNVNVWGDLTANNGNITLTASGAGKSVKIGNGVDAVAVTAGGDITMTGDKSAQLLSGSVESTNGKVTMTGKEYVAVNGDVTGKNVELKTTEAKTLSGAVGGYDAGEPAGVLQLSGTITASDGNVTIDSAGSVALQGTAVSAADNTVSITAGDTDAGQIVRSAGITAKTVSMKAKSVTGTGALSTDELGFEGESFSDDTLSVSKIAIRATGEGGNITVVNDKALTVGKVDGITGLATASGGNISVTAGGAISVTEAVTATGGNVMLDAGANSISILSDTSGGSVTLKSDATVGSDTKAPKLAATAAGGTIDASDQTLTLKKGEVSGAEIKVDTFNVDGGTVSAGSIKATTKVDQTGGEITAVMIDGAVAVDGDDSVLATSKIDGDLVQKGGEIRGLGAIVSDGPGDPEPPAIEITGAVTQSGGTLGNVAATDNVIIGGLLTQDGDDASIVAKQLSLKGGATQTAGMVEADEISLENDDADVSLAQSGNKIGTVGGSAKELDLVDSDGGLVLAEIGAAKLTIETAGAMTQVEGKTVTATAGDIVFSADTIETSGAIEATAGDVRLLAGNGATIGGTVSASSGNIRIDAGEGALAVNKAVGGQNVTLFAEGDITEGAAVGATADKLVESASGNIVVNEAGTVEGQGAYLAESGSITVADGKTLAAGDLLYVKANTVSGSVSASDLIVETDSGNAVRAAGGTIAYETGKTTVSGATKVAASTADDLVVDSGTSALEVGAFDAAAADVAITEVAPDKTPDHPAGTIDRPLVASGAGALEGIAAKSVDIDAGTVKVTKEVTATAGNVDIASTGAKADINVNAAVTATGGDAILNAARSVNVNADVTGDGIDIDAVNVVNVADGATVAATTGDAAIDATGNINVAGAVKADNGAATLTTTGAGKSIKVQGANASVSAKTVTLDASAGKSVQVLAGGTVTATAGDATATAKEYIVVGQGSVSAAKGTAKLETTEGQALSADVGQTPFKKEMLAGVMVAQNGAVSGKDVDIASAGSVLVDASSAVTAAAVSGAGGGTVTIAANGTTEATVGMADGVTTAGQVKKQGVYIDGTVTADGADTALTVTSAKDIYTGANAALEATKGSAELTATAGDITLAGTTTASGDVVANAVAGAFKNTGAITATDGKVDIDAGDNGANAAVINGVVSAKTGVTVDAGGNIKVQKDVTASEGDVTMKVTDKDAAMSVKVQGGNISGQNVTLGDDNAKSVQVLAGTVTATAGDVAIAANEYVVVNQNMTASKDVAIETTEKAVLTADLPNGAPYLKDSAAGVNVLGGTVQGENVTVTSKGSIQTVAGTTLKATAGNVELTAEGDAEATGTDQGIRIGGLVEASATAKLTAAAGTIADNDETIGHADDVAADPFAKNADGAPATHVTHVKGATVELAAKDGIGAATKPLDIEAGTITVESTAGSAYLFEKDAVTVNKIAAKNAKIETANGAITIDAAGDGITATEGNVLVAANGGNIVQGASITALEGDTTGSGNISVVATGAIAQNANITADGTVDVESTGAGITVSADQTTTAGGNIRYKANTSFENSGTIQPGADKAVILDAGTLTSGGTIGGDKLALRADTIGTETTPFKTKVANLAAEAKNGVWIENDGDVTIAEVEADEATINRISLDSTTTEIGGDTSAAISGLSTTDNGPVVLETKDAGDIVVEADVTAVGDNGNVTLIANGDGKKVVVNSGKTVQADREVTLKSNGGNVEIDGGIVKAGKFSVDVDGNVDETAADYTVGNLKLDAANAVLVQNGTQVGASGTADVDAKAGGVTIKDAGTKLAANKAMTIDAEGGDVAVQNGAYVGGKETVTVGGDSTTKNVTVDNAQLVAAGALAATATEAVTAQNNAKAGSDDSITLNGASVTAQSGAVVTSKGNVTATATTGDITVDAATVKVGKFSVDADGNVTAETEGNLKLDAANAVVVQNAAQVGASGTADVDAKAGGVTIKDAGTKLAANKAMTIDAEGGDVAVQNGAYVGGKETVTVGGDSTTKNVTVDNAQLVAAGALAATATEAVTAQNNAKAGSDDSITLNGASVTAQSGAVVTSKGNVTATATTGDITVDAATVKAGKFSVDADGNVTAETEGNLKLDAANAVLVQNGTQVGASGTADVDAKAGGVTIKDAGTKLAANKAMTIDAEGGDVAVQNGAYVGGKETVTVGGDSTTKNVTVDNAQLVAAGALAATATEAVTAQNNAKAGSDDSITLNGASVTAQSGAVVTSKGNVTATATTGDITVDAATVKAGKFSVDADGNVTAETEGNLKLDAANAVVVQNAAQVGASGTADVDAKAGGVTIKDAGTKLAANKAMTIDAEGGDVAVQNGAYVGGKETVTVGGDEKTKDVTVNGSNVESVGDLTVKAKGDVKTDATSRIGTDGDLAITAEGTTGIEAKGKLIADQEGKKATLTVANGAIDAQNADNDLRTVIADAKNNIDLVDKDDLVVSKANSAEGNVTITAGGDMTVQDDGVSAEKGTAKLTTTADSNGKMDINADVTAKNLVDLDADGNLTVAAGKTVKATSGNVMADSAATATIIGAVKADSEGATASVTGASAEVKTGGQVSAAKGNASVTATAGGATVAGTVTGEESAKVAATGGDATVSGTITAKNATEVKSTDKSVKLSEGGKVAVTGGAGATLTLNGKTGVEGAGTVDATGATLDVDAAEGNIALTGTVLANDATFDAQDISVYGGNNDFAGDVSAKATAGSIAIRDKNALKLKSADATQDARIVANGGLLDVAGAVDAGGNVLLQSKTGNVEVNAAVGSARTPKNVTIKAAGIATLKKDVTAKEDILVEGTKGVSSEVQLTAGKPGGTIAFIATDGAVSVNKGQLTSGVLYSKDKNGSDFGETKVGAGAIYVDTGKTIKMEKITDENATVAFTAENDVILKSSGNLTVGLSSGGSGQSANVTEVLEDVQKGTKERNLSAESSGGGLSGITAGNDVDIEAKSITGSSIEATRGNVDITTTGGDYSVSSTKAGRDVTLDVSGAAKGLSSVTAGGTADVKTGGGADVATLDAGAILADIGGDLTSKTLVKAKNDANLVVKGNVTAEEIAAGGALTIESGDLSFTTMSAKSVEATTGSISMGAVSASDATFDAKGSISDNGSEVATKNLTMKASGDIGSSSAPIVTKTQGGTLRQVSGRNVYVVETATGTVGIGTIHADGRLELFAPNLSAPNLGKDGRLTPSGAGRIEAGAAGALLDVAGHIGGVGKENHITLDIKGPLELRSGMLAGAKSPGFVATTPEGYVYVIVDAPGFDIDQWEGYNKNGGSRSQKIPGLVIVNGQVLEGNPDFIRNIHRAEAFTIETPELKSKQGVFGSPLFIHTDMDVSEAASIGSVDYLQMDWGTFDPIGEDTIKQWLRPKGLLGIFQKKRDNPMGTTDLYTKDYTDFETRRKPEEPKAKPDRSEKEKAKKEAKLREKADAAAQEAANREARDASPDVSSSASGPASAPGA